MIAEVARPASGLDSVVGRIFYGKPVATFPENAPGRMQ
jgi:hypothetical protein